MEATSIGGRGRAPAWAPTPRCVGPHEAVPERCTTSNRMQKHSHVLLMVDETWAASGVACVDAQNLVNGYSSFIARPNRQSPCMQFYRWVCW